MNKEAITMLCRASRRAQGLSLTELANRVGCSPATLSNFERGKFSIDYMNAYYLNVLNAAERFTLKELAKEKNNDER